MNDALEVLILVTLLVMPYIFAVLLSSSKWVFICIVVGGIGFPVLLSLVYGSGALGAFIAALIVVAMAVIYAVGISMNLLRIYLKKRGYSKWVALTPILVGPFLAVAVVLIWFKYG